jgi:hypothetical protein
MDKSKIKKSESIPENSSFNKLLKLQSTLQEEVALRDIFFEDRDSLLKKIENNCIDYYKMRISIQEIYDNKSNPDPSKKKIKYNVSDKPQGEIPQYYDLLSNLMYYFHDDNEMTLKLIEYCPKENYSALANFICNYFYVNIFSSTFLNENLLTLIYLLLEKEIDKIIIKNENEISGTFLDISNSFISNLLKCLSRKDEIKSFLENVLKKVLTRTAGFLNNQKDNMFFGFDIKKIVAFLNGRYQIKRTEKAYNSFLNLYTMEIKKSKLNLTKKKNKENEEFVVVGKGNDESNRANFENNFYVQATKETFENLLLGNDENSNSDDDDDDSSEDEEEMPTKKRMGLGGGLNNKKNIIKDDFEDFLVNSGFFIKENSEEEKTKKENIKGGEIFNDIYMRELNKETLLELLDREDDKDIEQYLLKQIQIVQDNEKSNIFTNTKLVNEIIHMGINSEELAKAILIYKYHFECVKLFIDELFTSLFQNKENVPYMIRAICTIISKLFSIKFQNTSNILKVKIISEFLFNNLIVTILENPQFNGTLIFDFTKDKNRNLKIKITIKVLQKLLNGELFNSTKNDEYLYTIFNPYFIEIMPFIYDFFREVSNSKLPVNIETLLENKKMIENQIKSGNKEKLPERSIKFDFLNIHPEERLEHQSMCLTFSDILIIYNIIKSKEIEILGDKTGLIFKTYKKITYHEDNLKSKVENDKKNFKKTFIYFSKLVLDKDLKEKMNSKKEQKLSFQADDTLDDKDNAKFILQRVKYSINTIIKHLNVLSRSNFMTNQNESTEDFIKGLNKMIKLEGFSEMLKENKLPLEWFGLYLQSNIENIPNNYKENNYSLLYNELIEESKQNLLKIQNDDSLNTIYSKIINSEKMIDIGSNNLKRIINNEKKFEIFDFIKNCNIPILMDIGFVQNNIVTYISFREDNNKGKSEPVDKKVTETRKCKDIYEFCEQFPNIDSDDVFILEEEIELNYALNKYFQIVHNYMEKEPVFNEYTGEEKKKIKTQIENFIHVQLFTKIYKKTALQADNNILQTIVKLSWVKPYMLDEGLKYLDEKMINLMENFISNMNYEMSPTNKLREFEKVHLIINNIITLYGYDKSIYIKLLVYIFIKVKPTDVFSTLRYIEIFLSEEMKEEKMNLITILKEVIGKIIQFSEKDLVGFSKAQFDEKIKNVTK